MISPRDAPRLERRPALTSATEQRPKAWGIKAIAGLALVGRALGPQTRVSPADHLAVRRLRTMTAVTFRQPRVLLSFALAAAVLWYMVTNAEGIADYAFVLGAAGLRSE